MEKKKRFAPVGPFAPPTPSEAEQERGMPMAVARDMQTTDDTAMPTSAPNDPGLPTPTPHGRDVRDRDDENRAHERPDGYSAIDENGWRRLEDEDQPSGRVGVARPERERKFTTDEDEPLGPIGP